MTTGPAPGLGPRLADELSRYLPAEALGPLGTASLSPPALADRAIRLLGARALELRGAPEAASRVRELSPLTGPELARQTMPALERIARATQAPADLVRAASQCAGALLRSGMPGGEEAGALQLVAAVTRLAVAAVRSGLPAHEVIALLVG